MQLLLNQQPFLFFKFKKAGNEKYHVQSLWSQLVGHLFVCAWYCHAGQSTEGWKKIMAMLLDHSFHISTASKHALNDLDLLYKQSHTTKKSLLFFESPGQHGYHGT